MRRTLFLLAALTFSTAAFAISDKELTKACLETGKAKILTQAETWGCTIDINAIEVLEVDNRWYSPSKYVWYQVLEECNGYERVMSLVQYYKDQCY